MWRLLMLSFRASDHTGVGIRSPRPQARNPPKPTSIGKSNPPETKKERPVAATTRRSVQGLASENDSKIIIAHRRRNASPTLSREGGVSR